MSVLTTTNRVDYTGDSTTVTFAFTYPIYQLSDLQVWTDDSNTSTNAPEGLLLRVKDGTGALDYIQSKVNFPGGVKGGSITFNSAPYTGMKVILLRVVSETQAAKYGNFDKWDAKSGIEQSFDLLEMQVQQMKRELDSSLGIAVDAYFTDPTLPRVTAPAIPSPTLIGINATGTGLKVLNIPAGTRSYTFTTSMSSRVVTFTTPGSFTWTVPAGVTRIYVEISSSSGGGGGGGGRTGVNPGGRGIKGAGGGWTSFTTTAITPGEVLDIVIAPVGTAGGPGALGAQGGSGGDSGFTTIGRRAPNAADRVGNLNAVAGRGFGGYGGPGAGLRGAGVVTGVSENSPGRMLGEGNWVLLGYAPDTTRLGPDGGNGGNGGYIVTQREIDLGENDPLEFGNGILPTGGQPGNPGYVAIYY